MNKTSSFFFFFNAALDKRLTTTEVIVSHILSNIFIALKIEGDKLYTSAQLIF